MMTFEEIYKNMAATASTVDVDVPEFGGAVRLRKLSALAGVKLAKQFAEFEQTEDNQIKHDEDRVEFYVKLLANSIVDPAGELMFLDETRRAVLRSLSFSTLSKLGTAAVTLNNLSDDDDDARSKRKKNSKTSRSGTSPSTSPAS